MYTGNRFAFALPLVLVLAFAMPARAQTPAELGRSLESDVRVAMAEHSIPGAAFAVVSGGQIAWIGTFGQTRLGQARAVDEHTVFRTASVSKGFAAALAAIMVNEGRFGWRDPITRYRPDFRIQGPVHAINIEDLLGQSTGIVAHAYDHLIEQGQSIEDIVPRFAELTAVCPPSTCYTYQNVAFSLIESVLETAGQAHYDRLLNELIFLPLGMDTASVGFESWQAATNRAEPHVRRMQQWHTVEVNPNYYRVNSAAGVNASVLDMAKWLIAKLGHRPEVLGPAVVDQVTRPRIRTERSLNNRHWRDYLTDAHYGLGWRIYRFGDEELVFHGGWVSGFRAEVAFSRRHDLGLVVLMNAESSVIGELSTVFWARAFDSLAIAGANHASEAAVQAVSRGSP